MVACRRVRLLVGATGRDCFQPTFRPSRCGERLWLAGSLAITASVLGQALAAAPAVHGYSRATGAEDEDDELRLPGRLP